MILFITAEIVNHFKTLVCTIRFRGKYDMRRWINLFESIVPPMDRDAIINHMIDHLTRGMYWDTDARSPKQTADEPMNDDSAADMASTWYDFGAFPELGEHKARHLDPNFIDDPIFQKKLRAWADERYDEVMEKLATDMQLENGMIAISRAIQVTHSWQPEDGLGIYWTFDYDGADIDDPPWADHSNERARIIWMHGLVEPQYVDWFRTILANMDWMSGDREHELRVNKGAPVLLKRFEYADTERSFDVNRVFRA